MTLEDFFDGGKDMYRVGETISGDEGPVYVQVHEDSVTLDGEFSAADLKKILAFMETAR